MSWTSLNDIATIHGWYKADAITGLSDGDLISSSLDSSGLARNLSASGSARPTYKTGIVNGLPVMRFGTASHVLSSSSYSLAAVQLSACVVVKAASLLNYQGFASVGSQTPNTAPSTLLNCYASVDGKLWLEQSATAYRGTDAGVLTTGTWYILTFLVQSDFLAFRRNGYDFDRSQKGAGTYSNRTGTFYTHIGNSSFGGSMSADCAEIVIWRETSLRESIWIEGYLANKYALSLENGHLFKVSPPQSAPATYNSSGGGTSRLINGGLIWGQVL